MHDSCQERKKIPHLLYSYLVGKSYEREIICSKYQEPTPDPHKENNRTVLNVHVLKPTDFFGI